MTDPIVFAVTEKQLVCGLSIACLLYPVCAAIGGLIKIIRQTRTPEAGIIMRHKPTGRIIYMPPHYEHIAIEKLLQDLKEMPALSSPEFERLL